MSFCVCFCCVARNAARNDAAAGAAAVDQVDRGAVAGDGSVNVILS